MKFPFLFKATEPSATTSTAASWPWPGCVSNPRTLSFRVNSNTNNIYKTMNSAFLDDNSVRDSEIASESCEERETMKNDESAVIRGMRSNRLFFEPAGETKSILEEAKSHAFPYKESSVDIMAMDSDDPFMDFRASMEEMVEAHGLKDWECLEELLTCYLRVNSKSNHGYIVGAFVDLLINLSLACASSSSWDDCSVESAIDEHCSSSSATTHYSFTSPLSFSSSSTYSSTSPCLSLLENEDEIAVQKRVRGCASGV